MELDYLSDPAEVEKAVQRMRELKIFEKMSDEDLSELVKISKFKDFKEGDVIIQEGDYDCWVYFLLSGSIKVVKDQQVLTTLDTIGEAFGEMGACDGKPRSASVIANEATSVTSFDMSIVDRNEEAGQHKRNYLISITFSQIVAQRLRKANEEIILLQKQSKEYLEKNDETTRFRRVSERYRANIPMKLKRGTGQVLNPVMINISTGGVACLVDDLIDCGDSVEIILELSGYCTMILKAVVKRIQTDEKTVGKQGGRIAAFQFVNIDEKSKLILQGYFLNSAASIK